MAESRDPGSTGSPESASGEVEWYYDIDPEGQDEDEDEDPDYQDEPSEHDQDDDDFFDAAEGDDQEDDPEGISNSFSVAHIISNMLTTHVVALTFTHGDMEFQLIVGDGDDDNDQDHEPIMRLLRGRTLFHPTLSG